jgi:hypothetical protein
VSVNRSSSADQRADGELARLLNGQAVVAGQQTWRVCAVGSAIDRHGFHHVTLRLDGAFPYLVVLCVSVAVHRTHGSRVQWLLDAVGEWLERPDKLDLDIIDLVA